MKSFILAGTGLAISAALSGCSIREAQIAMPSELMAETDRIELRGMGGGTSGQFTLGEARGVFTRSAGRLGIFDPMVVRRSGGGTFEIEGVPGMGGIAGDCGYREGEVNLGPVSLRPRRLALRCAFGRDGAAIDATLVVTDPHGPLGRIDGRSAREGILRYDGEEISIRSIHRARGGGLPTPTPLGYMFSVAGRQIGAVDLNGTNKTIFAPQAGPRREAVIAGAIALSIVWDPADMSD